MPDYKFRAFCPYRICPLGAHIDHQHGVVTGFALDRGVTIEYSPSVDTKISAVSDNFGGNVVFDITDIPQKQGDWADYLRGAVKALDKKHPLRRGLDAHISGSLPVGGLSSSAAVTIAFLSALCAVNDIKLSPQEMIDTARECENNYVGVGSGMLDQACEVYSDKDALLVLDTNDGVHTLIPRLPEMKPFDVCVMFSGVSRSLAASDYNSRVSECRMAAFQLLTFAGFDVADPNQCSLRDVPRPFFNRFAVRLPDNYRNRAVHYFTESDRVAAGIDAWKKGDIELFGRFVTDSGASSVSNYECGSPELSALFDAARSTDGVYGCRFSGAGFGGSLIALTDPSKRGEIEEAVTRLYLEKYPQHRDKFAVYFCKTADGCRI